MSTTQETKTTDLAQLDSEQDLARRISRIGSMTTHNGLLRCRVHDFVTSKQNTKVVMRVDTPFNVAEDDFERFHFKLPPTWDPTEYDLPRVLDWYGYSQNNWHVWEGGPVYLEFQGIGRRENNYQWEIAPPPGDPPSLPRRVAHRTLSGVRQKLRAPLDHHTHPVWSFTVTSLSAASTVLIVTTIAASSLLANILFSLVFAGAMLLVYTAVIGVVGDIAGWWSINE